MSEAKHPLGREGEVALETMRLAVREELEKKSLLGQYAIVNRRGKARRVLASKLLKELDTKGK